MKLETSCSFLLAVSALLGNAAAGPGAKVKACVYIEVEPVEPFTVSWDIGAAGDQCMSDKGESGLMEVSKQGLTCRYLGWVSIDNSWGCYVRQSWWTLAYTTSKAAYSGSTQSRWQYSGWSRTVTLHNYSSGTQLCGSEALCPTTKYEWSGNDGALYIVFQPSKSISLENNSAEAVKLEL
jgi:hypothetical protein